MDALELLALQIAWGADEALQDAPLDRMAAVPARAAAPLPIVSDVADAGLSRLPGTSPVPQRGGPAARARVLAAAATNTAALLEAVSRFEDCPLAATATSLVWEDGNPASGIMLVGEAPGEEEDRTGLPFQGPAGALLDQMLGSIGLDRTRVVMTTLVPWRPPGGRPPTESEVQMCLPFLQRHIALLAPRVLVTLGQLPTRALTGRDESIRKRRGRWTETLIEGLDAVVPTLPMFSPSTLLHTPVAKRDAWTDLLTLYQRMTGM